MKHCFKRLVDFQNSGKVDNFASVFFAFREEMIFLEVFATPLFPMVSFFFLPSMKAFYFFV